MFFRNENFCRIELSNLTFSYILILNNSKIQFKKNTVIITCNLYMVFTLIKIDQQMILDIKKQKKSFSWRLKIQNTNICGDKYTTKK